MGKLFQKVCAIETLRQAWKKIQRKKSQGGIDGVSVTQYEQEAEKHLKDLSKALLENRYTPEPTERIHVQKFNAAMELRPLSLPTVRDKVVQQAVRLVIEPFFERRFLNCSYAYRPEKGSRKAIGRVDNYIVAEKRTWVVFGDLDNFFDTINHERLHEEVKKVIFEPEILSLIHMWVKIGAMDKKGRYVDMPRGIAQGGIISPLLSNIYAHPLDEYLMGLKMAYVRYADNFIVLCHSKEEAQESLGKTTEFLEQSLKVRLNPEKNPIRSVEEGFVFLGIHFKGKDRWLAEQKVQKIKRKLDWNTQKHRPHPLKKIIEDLNETIDGARRYYGFLNPENQFKELDRYLLSRLRVLMSVKRERGQLKYKNELQDLMSGFLFFSTNEEKEKKALIQELVKGVFDSQEAGVVGPGEKTPPVKTDTPVAEAKPAIPIIKPVTGPVEVPLVPVIEPSGKEFSPNSEIRIPKSEIPDNVPVPEGRTDPQKPTESGSSPAPPDKETTIQSTPMEKSLQSADQKVALKKRHHVRKQFLESELVINSPGTFVGLRGNRVVLTRDRKTVDARPLIKVKGVLVHCHGVSISSNLVEACAKSDIPIVFSSFSGRPYAMIHSPLQSKPDLGLLQLKALDDGSALNWARQFVLGKLKNQLNLLKFYLRHREDEDPEYSKALDEKELQLEEIQEKVKELKPMVPYEEQRNRLFGFEGQAGVFYWQMIRLLLPEEVAFPGREHQGARDLVNAALNFGYSLLYPRMERALLLAGLNLYASLLHAPQPGKPTLSFDLIEIFRAPVVDRAVFSLLTRGRDLAVTTQGLLNAETRKMVIESVVGRLGTLVPYGGEKITLEQVIYRQARLLAESLRENGRFKPFISRY